MRLRKRSHEADESTNAAAELIGAVAQSRGHGLAHVDSLGVIAGRDREWRFALLGVIQAGGVAVPWPEATSARELGAIAADANAVLFVSARGRLDLVTPGGVRALSSDDLERRHKTLAAQ